MPAAFPYIYFEGVRTTPRTVAMLCEARRLAKLPLLITQGGYNRGGVAASAGTHDRDALDIAVLGLTDAEQQRAEYACREVGFAAYIREPWEGPWIKHMHMIPIGGDLSAGAAAQVRDYCAGRNALANHAPDRGTAKFRDQTWEKYLKSKSSATQKVATAVTDWIFDVAVPKNITRSKDIRLPYGKWLPLMIDDTGDHYSIATGPSDLFVLAQFALGNLVEGSEVHFRFFTVNYTPGKATTLKDYNWRDPIPTPVIGTGGDSHGFAVFSDNLGSAPKGSSRRLRIEACSWSHGRDGSGVVLRRMDLRVRERSL